MQTARVRWVGKEGFVAFSPSGHMIALDSDRSGETPALPERPRFVKFVLADYIVVKDETFVGVLPLGSGLSSARVTKAASEGRHACFADGDFVESRFFLPRVSNQPHGELNVQTHRGKNYWCERLCAAPGDDQRRLGKARGYE